MIINFLDIFCAILEKDLNLDIFILLNQILSVNRAILHKRSPSFHFPITVFYHIFCPLATIPMMLILRLVSALL